MLSYCRWRINAPFFSSQSMELPKPLLPRSQRDHRQVVTLAPRRERRPPRTGIAVLLQATSIPDTAAVGAATTTKDLPTPNINAGRMLPITEPGEGQTDSQAACSRDSKQQHPPPGRGQRHMREDGTSEHLPPQRAFAHPKKCPVQ